MLKLKTKILISGFLLLMLPSISHSNDLIFAVKSSDIEPYNLALKGAQEVFKAKELGAIVKVYDIKGDASIWKEVLKDIKEERPKVIMTFGTVASELVMKDVKDTPIVFSTVLNPEESGIVNSLTSPGGNVTGASLDIPVEAQFSYILNMVPAVKKVGVLYNPKETGLIVERARATASRMQIQLIAEPVNSEADLPLAIDRLFRQVDVLWSVADATVFSLPAIQKIIVETIRYKIPFMGISPSFVKAGALFSVKWDDMDIGKQAGEAVVKIISGRENISDIPVAFPREVSISINTRTARTIGLTIPDKILKRAEVFK